jgi:hypothetical protein
LDGQYGGLLLTSCEEHKYRTQNIAFLMLQLEICAIIGLVKVSICAIIGLFKVSISLQCFVMPGGLKLRSRFEFRSSIAQ